MEDKELNIYTEMLMAHSQRAKVQTAMTKDHSEELQEYSEEPEVLREELKVNREHLKSHSKELHTPEFRSHSHEDHNEESEVHSEARKDQNKEPHIQSEVSKIYDQEHAGDEEFPSSDELASGTLLATAEEIPEPRVLSQETRDLTASELLLNKLVM